MYSNLKYLRPHVLQSCYKVSLLSCLKGKSQECKGRHPVVKFSRTVANGDMNNLSFEEQ